MKSLQEIADEYAVNVHAMERHRDELYRRMQAEPNTEVRFRLRRAINTITQAIWQSQDAIRDMREHEHHGK